MIAALSAHAPAWLDVVWSMTWQGSLVALAVVLVSRVGGRLPASFRYGLLLVALVKLIVPPTLAVPIGLFSTIGPLAARIVETPIDHRGRQTASTRPWPAKREAASAPRPDGPVSSPSAGSNLHADEEGAALELASWLVLLHVAGAILLAARTVAQYVVLRRTVEGAARIDAGETYERMCSLARRLGLRRVPELRMTSAAIVPLASGVLRRRVLVPDLILRMSAGERDSVLGHELGHHRRGDLWIAAVTHAVSVFWWFNPMVWLLAAEIHRVREECCDDLVVGSLGVGRETYCGTLVRTACLVGIGAPAAVAARMSTKTLRARFRRIMSPQTPMGRRRTIVGTLASAALACGVLPGLTARDGVEFAGTVFGPDGRPFAGGRVGIQFKVLPAGDSLTSTATIATRVDGSFRLFVPVDEAPADRMYAHLFACGPGVGPAWTRVEANGAAHVRLDLVEDQVVKGRLIAPDGSPARGVRVRIRRLFTSRDGDLSSWLDAVAAGRVSPSHPWMEFLRHRFDWCDALGGGEAVADAEGVVELPGAGAGRLVQAIVDGPGIVTSSVLIVTTGATGITASRRRGPAGKSQTLHPSVFELRLQSGRAVQGVVRDPSGAPIAGATIRCATTWPDSSPSSAVRSVADSMRATSDAHGRYRLSGLPHELAAYLTATPGDETLFPATELAGADSTTVDFTLGRTVVLNARVVDRTTGRGVRDAAVRYGPDLENPWVGGARVSIGPRPVAMSDRDGRVEIAVATGPGEIEVIVGDDRMKPIDFDGTNARVAIDPDAGRGPIELDLEVISVPLRICRLLDAQGNEVHGARLLRVPMCSAPETLEGSAFELREFEPAELRAVLAEKPDRGIAGVLDPALTADGEYVLRMQPTGRVHGRLVDDHGLPRTGVRLGVMALVEGQGERTMIRHLPICETDSGGRFEFAGLVPGVTYTVADADLGFPPARAVVSRLRAEPGASLDLADVRD